MVAGERVASLTPSLEEQINQFNKDDPLVAEVRRGPRTWSPKLELDGAPIPWDTSLRNYHGGRAGLVAEALEQPLLPLKDIESYRRFSQYVLFLSLKRDLVMITQQVYVAEEWNKRTYNEAQAEAHTWSEVEKTLSNLKEDYSRLSKQLKEITSQRNNLDAGLKTAEKQAEDQRKQLRMTEIKLETERELVKGLRAELQNAKEATQLAENSAQLAKEAVEAKRQAAYTLGVEETQVRYTEEFAKVCREYCDMT
ncbi:uncharacterized protein LOC136069341 [Quercus suber]|uniref:uncharacterized protein LOC136069341 n=1 Tax=Quercus suber TaxID=58331 RepID=UPI0032DE434A